MNPKDLNWTTREMAETISSVADGYIDRHMDPLQATLLAGFAVVAAVVKSDQDLELTDVAHVGMVVGLDDEEERADAERD